MKSRTRRTPIPWVHNTNPLVTSWIWDTPHFTVTIYAEGLAAKKMFHWKISEKSSGVPVPFDSSDGNSFQACVDAALEVVGKSFDRALGYQQYAGSLATTFIVADGRRLDFSPLVGETVTVTAQDETGDTILINGMLDVDHYNVSVQTGENTFAHITPSFILDVRKEFSTVSALDLLEGEVKSSKGGRVFYEEWRRGCTGRPGFNAGTVEHSPSDPFCPIHNI